jgi:hypothetical protein
MVFSSHTNDARSTLAEIEELLYARNNDCGAWTEYQLQESATVNQVVEKLASRRMDLFHIVLCP